MSNDKQTALLGAATRRRVARLGVTPRAAIPGPRRAAPRGPGEGLAAPFGVVLLVAALACGGSGKGADDASSAYVPKSTTPWKNKSREQRMEWMGIVVFPAMRKIFLEQDSEKYADFSCQTCHGEGMEMVDFEMPNDLFALSPTDTLAQAKEYDEKTTDFMLGAVVPEMAKLLDMEALTLENQTGFGCIGCHPANKE